MTDNPSPSAGDISGYRKLTDDEIDLINEAKALAERNREFIERLESMAPMVAAEWRSPAPDTIDKRWLSIGRTDLQKGFMAVVRSIAKPTSF